MTPALQALLDDLTAERFARVVPEHHNLDMTALVAQRQRDAVEEFFAAEPEPLAVVVPLVREAS